MTTVSGDHTPTLHEVLALKAKGAGSNVVPISREINADLETPVSTYLKVARGPYSFLLESVEGGERIARYSFIGTEPYDIIKTGPNQPGGSVDPLGPIETALSGLKVVPGFESPRFDGGAVGYLSYESVGHFERLPSPDVDPLGLPESVFMLCDTYLVFDHVRHRIRIVSHARLDGDVAGSYESAAAKIDEIAERLLDPLESPPVKDATRSDGVVAETPAGSEALQIAGVGVTANMSRDYYDSALAKITDYIVAGDCIQVVISQRFSAATSADPLDVYRAMRGINPSPYMFFLDLDGFQIVGSSPETLVRCVDGEIDYHPIAGTRPRGATHDEDEALAEEMLADEKERAEHIMLVDLGRNDVGRVSDPGSVEVTQLMDVERYSHVMHIVSHVRGRLKTGLTCYDALRACFPAGTVSGAPKIRAMEIIAELEPVKRGPYAGAVGYFSLSGDMDTAIALRTMVMKDGVAHIQAGGGIVFDSVAGSEYEETINKASSAMKALAEAQRSAEAQSSARAQSNAGRAGGGGR
jgi:anthranilate synthase component 1